MQKPDPVELVAVALPVALEIVAVTLFIAAGFVALIVMSTSVPV